MHKKHSLVGMAGLMTMLLVVGCGEDGPWVGTYDVQGTWKLSGPLEGGKTVGQATSELLVDQVAGALPAPSFVEDKVRKLLESSVGGAVRIAVDKGMPADLGPDGKVTKLLRQTLAAVDLESTLQLEGESGGELEGTETVMAIEYVINGKRHRVSAGELADGAQSSIDAPWSGEEFEEGTLSVAPHSVAIRYGALVRLVASDLLQASELSALDAQVKSALSCKTIVAAITGGGSGLKISVIGWDHTIGAAELEQLCDSALSSLTKKTLGRFELDSRVEVGGDVAWSITPGTGAIKLDSRPNFGGIVNIAPAAIAPKVGVSFQGTQQQQQ
jgi:hypothetical protein